MLRRLSGRTHQAVSAVSVVSAGREAQALVVTDVTFADLDEADITAYVASGEAMGKAGAYGIQGRAEQFVTRLAGSYSAVMGLPLHETAKLLRTFSRHMRTRDLAALLASPFRKRALTKPPDLPARMLDAGLTAPVRETLLAAA